jgi:hypothetical protein
MITRRLSRMPAGSSLSRASSCRNTSGKLVHLQTLTKDLSVLAQLTAK